MYLVWNKQTKRLIIYFTCKIIFVFHFRTKSRCFEETIFTRSEGTFQRTVFTDYNRQFSTEIDQDSFRSKIQHRNSVFQPKTAFTRATTTAAVTSTTTAANTTMTAANTNGKTYEELDKIEVCPNNTYRMVKIQKFLFYCNWRNILW